MENIVITDLIEKSHPYDNSPDIEQVKTFSDNTSKDNRSTEHGKARKSTISR